MLFYRIFQLLHRKIVVVTNWSEHVWYRFQLSFVLSRWRNDIAEWYCNKGFIVLLCQSHTLTYWKQIVNLLLNGIFAWDHIDHRCMFWIVCCFYLNYIVRISTFLYDRYESVACKIAFDELFELVALIAPITELYTYKIDHSIDHP